LPRQLRRLLGAAAGGEADARFGGLDPGTHGGWARAILRLVHVTDSLACGSAPAP